MKTFLLFSLLWYVLRSPFLAIIVLILIVYVIDRKFVGLFPSLLHPFRQYRRLSKLQQQISLNPHDTSAKLELARIHIERRRYRKALPYLLEAEKVMDGSAEVKAEIGLCQLRSGELEEGEAYILAALAIHEKVKYGEPLLVLGEAWADRDCEKAIRYLQRFRQIQSSSCKGYVRLGQLYEQLDRKEEAKQSYQEAIAVYKGLPSYKKRQERRWVLIAQWRNLIGT